MTPFERGTIEDDSVQETFDALLEAWRTNDPPHVRSTVGGDNEEEASSNIRRFLDNMKSEDIWLNDIYQVSVAPFGGGVRLAVRRKDRQPIHDWRHMQAIKNELVGPECEGVELFPAESRLVDTANQYYMWCCKTPGWRFPFGFGSRAVFEGSVGSSVNRKLEVEP